MSNNDILTVLWVFTLFLVTPIIICWSLFGIAWLKGWRDPEITPIEIIDRLLQK